MGEVDNLDSVGKRAEKQPQTCEHSSDYCDPAAAIFLTQNTCWVAEEEHRELTQRADPSCWGETRLSLQLQLRHHF